MTRTRWHVRPLGYRGEPLTVEIDTDAPGIVEELEHAMDRYEISYERIAAAPAGDRVREITVGFPRRNP